MPVVQTPQSPPAIVVPADTTLRDSTLSSSQFRVVGMLKPPAIFEPRAALDYVYDQIDAKVGADTLKSREFVNWVRSLSEQDAGVVRNWHVLEQRRELLVNLWREFPENQREGLVEKFYPGIITAVKQIDQILHSDLDAAKKEESLRELIAKLHPSLKPLLELAYNMAASEPNPITKISETGLHFSFVGGVGLATSPGFAASLTKLKGFDDEQWLLMLCGDPESKVDKSDWKKLAAQSAAQPQCVAVFQGLISNLGFDLVEYIRRADRSEEDKAALLKVLGPAKARNHGT